MISQLRCRSWTCILHSRKQPPAFLQGKSQVAKMCQIWNIPHCYWTHCVCARLSKLSCCGWWIQAAKGAQCCAVSHPRNRPHAHCWKHALNMLHSSWTYMNPWLAVDLQEIVSETCSRARAIRSLTSAFPGVWWMQAEGAELITVSGEASSSWHLSDNFTVPSASQEIQIWLCDGPHWECQFKARFRMPDWVCELCMPYGTCRLGTLEGC